MKNGRAVPPPLRWKELTEVCASLWMFSWHVPMVGGLREDLTEEIIYPVWPWNDSGFPRLTWKMLLRRRMSGFRRSRKIYKSEVASLIKSLWIRLKFYFFKQRTFNKVFTKENVICVHNFFSDYIGISKRWKSLIKDFRTCRGAEISSDHYLLWARIRAALTNDGDVEHIVDCQIGKAGAVLQQLRRIWMSTTVSMLTKIGLFDSIVISTVIIFLHEKRLLKRHIGCRICFLCLLDKIKASAPS